MKNLVGKTEKEIKEFKERSKLIVKLMIKHSNKSPRRRKAKHSFPLCEKL